MTMDVGERGAGTEWARALIQPLQAFFLRRGFPHPEAEDLTQETLRRVYSNMSGFRGEAPFKAWVLRIAANVWKNALRDASAQKRAAETLSLDTGAGGDRGAAPIEVAGSAVDGERQALDRERGAILQGAIERLPRRKKVYVLLYYLQQRTQPEIAELMGISRSTVKSQLKEARAQLRADLEKRLGSEAVGAVGL